jgi:hypothetical protein
MTIILANDCVSNSSPSETTALCPMRLLLFSPRLLKIAKSSTEVLSLKMSLFLLSETRKRQSHKLSSKLKTIKIGHSSLHHMFMSNSPLQRVCFMAVGFWRSASWSCCCSWPSSWIAWPHGGRPTWGYGSHLGPPSWNRCWIKREKGIKKKVIWAP